MVTERKYQSELIRRLKMKFPGCIVLKNDPNYIQGVPDLLVLFGPKWAALEVKKSHNAPVRPNQKHYVDIMNKMGYSAFIYPENEESIFDDLQRTFYT